MSEVILKVDGICVASEVTPIEDNCTNDNTSDSNLKSEWPVIWTAVIWHEKKKPPHGLYSHKCDSVVLTQKISSVFLYRPDGNTVCVKYGMDDSRVALNIEVMPGATSPLSISTIVLSSNLATVKSVTGRSTTNLNIISISHNHVLLNTLLGNSALWRAWFEPCRQRSGCLRSTTSSFSVKVSHTSTTSVSITLLLYLATGVDHIFLRSTETSMRSHTPHRLSSERQLTRSYSSRSSWSNNVHKASSSLLPAMENLWLVPFLELVDGTGCRTALDRLARFQHTGIMTSKPVYGRIAVLALALVNHRDVIDAGEDGYMIMMVKLKLNM
uniref:Uncharacterized protein n=1 Tax=Timema bartmani TaxID=61472 RepID=A0A7R9I2N9_9NEOP|nr:unnamed protein product [Timema bartmani]